MTLNQSSTSPSWLAKAVRFAGKGVTAAALLFGAGAVTAGCLDRPVTPAVPTTTNVYIDKIRQTGVDKIDLLFMIDNSISMSDKQAILADAVPVLVQRLIQPTCVDMQGMPVGNAVADANGNCPAGQGVPEFKPIQDIHIGVITSSLGDHGSNDVCSDAQNAANVANGLDPSFYNDAGQLLPSVRPDAALYSWANKGFLVWDPRDQKKVRDPHTPITNNETDPGTLGMNFAATVKAAGEHGCGYEASLEAWYRFLVDPDPVRTMSNDGKVSVRPTMHNDVVLQQRAAFLRPDSLLAVIMLSDENDCSIIDEDGQQGWLVGFKGGVGNLTFHMPRGNSACAADPNSANCRPCGKDDPDPGCAMGQSLTLNEDSMNERCFNQRMRFGVNLLYPPGRYSEGLSQKLVNPRGTGQVPNPIYATTGGEPPREPELVFLAGIVGVPWQDISDDASRGNGRGLKYMTAEDLDKNNRWAMILGDPDASPPIPPTDPLMIESIDPRPTGAMHPLLPNAAIVPPTGGGGMNPINGHEQAVLDARDDLQFACIFPLSKPVDPATCGMKSDGCDCNADEFDKHSPLCTGVTATADGTQVAAKAYPGVRELQVLKLLGKQSIVASICPKNSTAMGAPASDPSYGYNPAVAAIVDRLKEVLTVKCLPRPLAPGVVCADGETKANCVAPEDQGKVPCAVVEARPPLSPGMCDTCDPASGRLPLTDERGTKIVAAAREYLGNVGDCTSNGANGTPVCRDLCFCELQQFTGDDLAACKTGMVNANKYGYCYVDPAAETDQSLVAGEETLVRTCKATQKRILNFVGNDVPSKDGVAFIACIGANPNE